MAFTNGFEVFLALAAFITGALWLVGKRKPLSSHLQTVASYFTVFLLVLLIRSFVFQPFHVVSGSLEPTILIGDILAVNPAAYGVFLPITHTRLLATGKPKTGDIALFYFPDNPSDVYVKRVIGTPGDHVEYHNKQLTLNGRLVETIKQGVGFDEEPHQAGILVDQYQENLSGILHDIYINPRMSFNDNIDVVVPAGMYFMMGDNRDDSDDSRRWGFVPEANLIGRTYGKLINWQKLKNFGNYLAAVGI